MFRKIIFCIFFLCSASFVFSLNKTGIVIDIKQYVSNGYSNIFIMIDTNNDKIIDACIILSAGDYERPEVYDIILTSYIKIGNSIVFNSNGNTDDLLLRRNAIISINGIGIDKLVPSGLKYYGTG